MSTLHIDLESRSAVDLKKTGTYVYAADPTTDVWCACYAFDDGEVKVWRPGDPCPPEIVDHVLDDGIIFAHNANFERVMWARILGPRYHWPVPLTAQWRCTMVMAYAMALPGSLDQAAPAAGLAQRKDAAGGRLMLQMARPRKRDPLTWWNEPEKVQRLIDYCTQDVIVERELEKRLRPLKESELALWHLDCRINDRGVLVDEDLCVAAKRIVGQVEEEYDRRMLDLTEQSVTACSNRNQLVKWLRANGLDAIESVAKDQIEELLGRKDLKPIVRQVLELRLHSAKASVAKIDALLAGMDADGGARGLLQFHAASTGRWCIAEGTPVLVRRDGRVFEKPIESVEADDEVWDGDEWVAHEGVVFSGEKEVIEHDGLTASPDHKVYVDDREWLYFDEAKRRGVPLWRGNTPS